PGSSCPSGSSRPCSASLVVHDLWWWLGRTTLAAGPGDATATAARRAAPVELHAVMQHLEARGLRGVRERGRLGARRHIVDPAARDAGEVIVALEVAVEAQLGTVRPLGEEPLGGEPPQVPVDGGQAHARQAAPDAPIDE